MAQYFTKSNLANLADELACFAALEPRVIEYAKVYRQRRDFSDVTHYAATLFEVESGWPHAEPLFSKRLIKAATPQIREVLTAMQ